MAETSIQWCDHSINPLRARNLETGKVGHFCAKVSQGCKNCYSSKLQTPHLVGLPFVAENRPKVELFFEEKAIHEVLRRKKPTKYFWCDMTDMFWEEYPDEWIDRCFAAMALTPQHTHLVLTKRASRLLQYFTDSGHKERMLRIFNVAIGMGKLNGGLVYGTLQERNPLSNVWLGVSVEDQATADERIPLLLQAPAAIRFVSYEPALGPVDFTNIGMRPFGGMDRLRPSQEAVDHGVYQNLPALSWVIIGGESGPGARPFDLQWARDAIEQCTAAGVAVFCKQLGARTKVTMGDGAPFYLDLRDRKGGSMEEWPEDLRVRQFPFVQSPDKMHNETSIR